MKIFRWIFDNILFVLTLFLLAFIPLYPKLPLLDVVNTWVYIRAEDFVVAFVLLVLGWLLLLKKVTLRTPLTMPILLFWIVGAIATIHAVVVIFPSISNVFPNVAFLSFLRRVEYISLFFVAFWGIREKRFLAYVIGILVLTFFLVFGYGLGQKYFGFYAYLTMNEEFAKGLPIQLSSLSRVPSTFGGHYDLAAYLVLIIPIFTSLVFGFKRWVVKLILLVAVVSGVILLFMTVSRVSFFVLLISLLTVLFFYKKKFVLLSLPIIAILAFISLSFSTSLLERFGNTVKEIDVLVDAKSGEPLGHVQYTSAKEFENKLIVQTPLQSKNQLSAKKIKVDESLVASPSSVLLPSLLPEQVVLVTPPNTPTGENLPRGTGYINLSLSPVTKRIGYFLFDNPVKDSATRSADTFAFSGDFLVKRASAYDLSFTTRFQGEWPRAIEAFKKNVLVGSGYSSISLAVDNNYLRILGEIGLLGFVSFFGIFLALGIYIKKVLPDVDSPLVRSFILGFVAGLLGLMLNALLIDVFEASKIAFLLWLLTGVTVGTLHLYQKTHVDIYKECKKVVTSTYAIIIYLGILTILVFSHMVNNFFVGDDFTWFRWAAEDPAVLSYFADAQGFFYRPGTKAYFLIMYSIFWLNQIVYHIVSVILHFTATILMFLIAKKVLKDFRLAALSAFIFLIMSGYAEIVFWTAATGHLFNVVFILASLLFFILWGEKKRTVYLVLSLIFVGMSLLFHELGVVSPLLMLLYVCTRDEKFTFDLLKKREHQLLFAPVFLYLIVRFLAQSHWFSGDYSYNLLKLPYNFVGNAIGYLSLTILGPISLPMYQMVRTVSREYIVFGIFLSTLASYVAFLCYKNIIMRMEKGERSIIIFGSLFFIISLLPFLGLGNITSRYSYLASIGIAIIFALLVRKLYHFILSNGRDVATAVMIMLVGFYSLLHIIQVQQVHIDWHGAGEKSERFFISIDSLYKDYWASETATFHFVNIPIRVGEAWVFPVGLEDALWLAFRNPNIHVYKAQSVEQAQNTISSPEREEILEFDESGKVVEKIKMLDVR